jgi:para-aminobenzoyl-glutamate transporter family
MANDKDKNVEIAVKKSWLERFLNGIETVGNKLPDPAILFLIGLLLVWVLSLFLSPVNFAEIDPRNQQPLKIENQLSGSSIAGFLSRMVGVFTGFAPLGIVLVAMLGVGVAEHSGYINAGLKYLLNITPKMLLTPMVIAVGIASHSAVDAGYVLVIPLGAVIFHVAGRHPLAGVAAAFAGVSGGFSANFLPSALDPLLQGFTQTAARIIDPDIQVNPLCNYYFTSLSSVLIILAGWFLTDKFVEPRLSAVPVDSDTEEAPEMHDLSAREKRAFWLSTGTMILGLLILFFSLMPGDSPLRAPDGQITSFQAPIMQSIVPLIFLLFVIPGTVYGYAAKTFRATKDVVGAMTKAMHSMSYYIVMAFFASLFIDAFGRSNIGPLLALKGAAFLQMLGLPGQVTIVGIILLTSFVNLFVGSASAKWALISPIFVPMLMQLRLSPELTQAAYRVGDSTSNIITPLMPYFPLVVVFCRRYVKSSGIGTVVSLMLPYTVVFLILWSIFLIVYWALGIPLGLQSRYVYP